MAKRNLKFKNIFSLSLSKKAIRPRKLVKDKAIVNFLLEHMKPVKINFSKIKIPSFLNSIENEKNDSTNSNIFQVENIQDGSPIEGISLNDFYDNVKK